MSDATFKILGTLSTGLGNQSSINELTKKIAKTYGAAYYPGIYEKLHEMERDKIINLTKIGTSSIAQLNFENYLLIDLLSEMELKRKQAFLKNRIELQLPFMKITTYCRELSLIKSICAIKPERNATLNRLEFLILLRSSKEENCLQNEINKLRIITKSLQNMHNIRIDYLTLFDDEFFDLLRSEEINPIKEMLSDKIAFLYPQEFWMEIKEAMEKGIQIKFEDKETNPADIREHDLAYNLMRFGYTEIGTEIKQGQKICIEYIITSLLMQEDIRRIEAIPIILAKNNANYNLLTFLSQKYGLSETLLGLLRALEKIKPNKNIEKTIDHLKNMGIKESKFDEKTIMEKMRLYNAI